MDISIEQAKEYISKYKFDISETCKYWVENPHLCIAWEDIALMMQQFANHVLSEYKEKIIIEGRNFCAHAFDHANKCVKCGFKL